ncbi:hypothetical protein OR1_03821 [Geobacter sp. OR-1]|uniref:TPM domain-containing protein n=1 Tax=Geobacter sp. OR-1 TaxID=1266765 RepID=UPI0005439C75|nr:hypothetical protein [Geobacter sp. OR-1]GAM11505.1 hypothetical protein OR1_03821 [Geobacter sp. OR-1]
MKQRRGETYFSATELERIRQAVHAAELNTSGEIATMTIAESDRYLEAEVAGSLFLAASASLVIALATRHVTIWSYIPMAVLLYIPCCMLIRTFPRLKLPFAGRRRVAEAVRQRAVRAFYEKGLYRTRHETGILIFMSLLERKVWILGDRGINERIDPASWGEMAGSLARGIAAGNGCDALCEVIGRCGAELSRHFPHQADDVNELQDDLITEVPK